MLKRINPAGIPAPSTYAMAVEATQIGRMLFVSGQVGVTAEGNIPDDIGGQTRAAIANLQAVLAAADMTVDNVAKYTVFMTQESDTPGFMEAGQHLMPNPPTAITLVYVKALASPAMRIEIEAIAVA